MGEALILLIKLYRKYISSSFGSCCKFVPSCSLYAIESIQRYGAFKGVLNSMFRIVRCNPLSKGGFDPVGFKFKTGDVFKKIRKNINFLRSNSKKSRNGKKYDRSR